MTLLSGGQFCDDDDDYDIDDDDHDELWPFWPVLQARDAQQEGGPEQVAHQANQVGQAHCEPAYGHKGIPAHCGEAPNNGQKNAMQRADCAAQEGAVQEDGPQDRIVG